MASNLNSTDSDPELDALKGAYSSLLLWTNSIVLSFSIFAFIFVLVFRKRPVIVLSQVPFLVGVTVCLATLSGAYFAGTADVGDCWVHYILWYLAFNVFFALITAREWRVWRMYKAISEGKRGKVSALGPMLYVAAVAVAIVLIVIFTWLLPYTQYGTKPCQRAVTDKPVTPHMAAVAQTDCYFGVLIHVIALVIAFMARNVPSICGDAQSILLLSALGIIYIGLSLASYNTNNPFTRTNLRIAYTVVDFVLQLSALYLLIFKRVFYMHLTNIDLVKKFLGIELEEYEAVAYGVKPINSRSEGLGLGRPGDLTQQKTTHYTTRYYSNEEGINGGAEYVASV